MNLTLNVAGSVLDWLPALVLAVAAWVTFSSPLVVAAAGGERTSFLVLEQLAAAVPSVVVLMRRPSHLGLELSPRRPLLLDGYQALRRRELAMVAARV